MMAEKVVISTLLLGKCIVANKRRQRMVDTIAIYLILNANLIATKRFLHSKSTGTDFLPLVLGTCTFAKN